MAFHVMTWVLLSIFITTGTAVPYMRRSTERHSNPCALGAVEMYHPYPGDETRYIQCSQWGQSHIKSCGTTKVWNNGLKTCVHKQTHGTQSQSGNKIYTTGPSGYQMENHYDQVNYGYHRDYDSNNYNAYQHHEQPQYYIDANNNVGASYSSGYRDTSARYQVQTNSIQNDPGYSRSAWSNDISTYPAQGNSQLYANQNSLWNMFTNSLYSPNQNMRAQDNQIYGQSMTGATNRQQSGRMYGRETRQNTGNYQSSDGNALWNAYAAYLMRNANSVMNSQPNQISQNTMSATRHTNSQSAGQAYSSQTSMGQYPNNMVSSQRQAPAVNTQHQSASSITQPISGFDVPELCRDADMRYIPAQNDYHHFYECVRGSAQIKTCPDGEVWIHPLRRCVDLNDQSNKIPSHNPCIGSDLRFHPYPTDPTKYVECQSWYRVYVWRCKDGLWTQNKQQCSAGPHTGGTTQNNQGSTKIKYFPGQCDGTTYYYAHENPAKYVQCDEWGNWFLKDCALNTTWDPSLTSCVASAAGSGPVEAVTNAASSTSMERASRQLPANVDETSLSYPCPANYAWDLTRNECVAVSLSDYLPPCPRGYMWDSNLNECVMYVDPSAVEEFPDAEYASPNCPERHRWDPQLQMCVQDTLIGQLDTNFLMEIDVDLNDFSNQQNVAYTAVEASYPDYPDYGNELDTLPNICNSIPGKFYFAYPGKTNMFIQCDQLGVMHAQKCGEHSIWNDDIATCVHHLSVKPGDSRQYNGGYQDTNDQYMYGDVCQDSENVYYPYSANKRMFIMCFNNIAYMMSCPYGSFWQDSITSCNWPQENEE